MADPGRKPPEAAGDAPPLGPPPDTGLISGPDTANFRPKPAHVAPPADGGVDFELTLDDDPGTFDLASPPQVYPDSFDFSPIPDAAPMPDPAVSGTNSEKIDQLVGLVAALRTDVASLRGELDNVRQTLRLIGAAAVLVTPIVVGLLGYQSVKISDLSGEVKALTVQMTAVQQAQLEATRELKEQRDRITRLEAVGHKP